MRRTGSLPPRPVLRTLPFVVGERSLEVVEPLSMLRELVVEVGDRLVGLEEPQEEDAEHRLVPHGSVGRGFPQPPLCLGEAVVRDGVGLASSRALLGHAKQSLGLKRCESGIDLGCCAGQVRPRVRSNRRASA